MGKLTKVGAIALDLVVNDLVTAQISEIAQRAKSSAAKAFDSVGEKAGEAMSKSVSEGFSDAEVQKSLEDAVQRAVERANQAVQKTPIEVPVEVPRQNFQKFNPADIQKYIDDFAAKPAKPAKQKGVAADEAAPVDMSRAFTAAQAPADLLAQKMANLRDQMEQARRKSAEIDAAFDRIGTDGSAELDKLSAAYTQVEARIISIQQQLDATQAKIDAPAAKAQAAAEKAAAKAEAAAAKAAAKAEAAAKRAAAAQQRAAERTAAAQQRAAERAEKAQIRATQRTEKARLASIQRQQARTKAAARAQAGAFLSAATSSAKGIGKVGVMGRAALTSLRGLATAVPFAAMAAGFGLLKKSISTASDHSAAFQKNLNSLKASLSVAFTPIYQAILPALNQLMATLANAARAVASFVSGVFGKTYAQSLAATKALQKTAAAAGSSQKSLTTAGFDEVNILSGGDSGGGSSGGTDLSAVSAQGDAIAEALGAKIAALFDFSKLTESFTALMVTLEPIAAFIFNNIILPLSTWAVNEGLPAFFDLLAAAAAALLPVAESLWNNFLQPVASWTGDLIVTVFEDLAAAFNWIAGNQVVCDILAAVLAVVIAYAAAQWVVNAAMAACPITWIIAAIAALIVIIVECVKHWDDIKAAAVGCWERIKAVWDKVADWMNTKIIQPVVRFFVGMWNKISGFASSAWNGIKAVWNAVAGWMNTKVIQPVARFFKGMWDGIVSGLNWMKQCFTTVFNALVWIAKQPLNLIIALVNGAISGVNLLIKGLNKIHVDIPSWIPGIGGKSLGFNIKEISKLPYLAGGGIASQPTLAMIGEYAGARSNPEVVAPLDKLQTLLGQTGDDRVVELLMQIVALLKALKLNVNIGGKKFQTAVIDALLDAYDQGGGLPLPV